MVGVLREFGQVAVVSTDRRVPSFWWFLIGVSTLCADPGTCGEHAAAEFCA